LENAIYDKRGKGVNRRNFGKMPVSRVSFSRENTITRYDDFEADGIDIKGLSVHPPVNSL